MAETEFYKKKNGEKAELCKKCLAMHVDYFKPDTYLWILEQLDVPYVEGVWTEIRDRTYARDPKKLNGPTVLGKYLSQMKLGQWNKYGWADTEKIEADKEAVKAKSMAEMAEADEDLKAKFEAGEIGEAEYKTLASTQFLYEDPNALNPYAEADGAPQGLGMDNAATAIELGPDNPYDKSKRIDAPETAVDLTNDEIIYLANKWGRNYSPEQWAALELDYDSYTKSFDVQDADTKNALKMLCKTNLKANEAIDNNDIEAFQKLTKVSETLRKTSKFTAQQNKEEKGNIVDSVGEIVRFCEQKGGYIPKFVTDTPKDTVDVVVRDNERYINTLVKSETGLGGQLEAILAKIDIQRKNAEADTETLDALFEEPADATATIEDYEEYAENYDEMREADLEEQTLDPNASPSQRGDYT